MPTTIQIFDEDWSRLNARKQQGDGFKDVVNRVLDELEEYEAQDTGGDDVDDPAPEQRELQEPVDDLDQPDGALHGEGQPLTVAGDDVQEEPDDPLDGIEEHVRHGIPIRGKSEDDVDAMLGAVSAAIEYIRTHGEVGQSDLERALYEDHSGPYTTTNSWYKRMLKPGLKAAIDAGDVGIEAPVAAGDKWEAV